MQIICCVNDVAVIPPVHQHAQAHAIYIMGRVVYHSAGSSSMHARGHVMIVNIRMRVHS